MLWGVCGHGPCPEGCCPLLTSSLPPSPQDCFFYSLVFDPVQKTLLADQGEIRVGCKYQAEIPDRLAEGERRGRVAAGLAVPGPSLCRAGLPARAATLTECSSELEGTGAV